MELHSGELSIKVPSSQKTELYSNLWCIVYSGRSNNLSPRIDLYENKSQVGKITCNKTIYIQEAKWVKIDSVEFTFSFEVKHNKQYLFVTSSKAEFLLWILVLCCASKELFDTKDIIGIESLDKMETSYIDENGEEIIVTNNILYSSCRELSSFVVLAEQSDGCLQYGLKGPYKLHIDQTTVKLLQHNTDKMVVCWSLHMVKQFGHSSHTFFLEAGTRSPTGAGRFTFHTSEGKRIANCLHQNSGQFRTQSSTSENSQLTIAPTVTAETYSQSSKVKSKPPPTPDKPKSLSIRSKSFDTDQLHYSNSLDVSDHQLTRKGAPAFGVSVLPLTTQALNQRVSDIVTPPEENETKRRESLDNAYTTINNQTENNNNKRLLKKSVSNQSEFGSVKDRKKEEKELKKEQKRKAEEEKKAKKRQEEEKKREQKRREEEEKRIKKEQKKNKQKASKRPSETSISCSTVSSSEYTEADLPVASSSYTEINVGSISPKPPILFSTANSEQIYSEPWGLLPIMPGIGGNEVIYSQPEKMSNKNMVSIQARDIIHTEYYEECKAQDSQDTGNILNPPEWVQLDNDSSTNLYSHFNDSQSTVAVQENIYGMASALNSVSVSEDENPYEETGIST